MSNILDISSDNVLELFQTAYENQTGGRMHIGSEEYTLSSIFTYVMTHYAGLINQSYKNQILETASGEFLDNIGKRYSLTRNMEFYGNPWFEGYFTMNTAWDDYSRDIPVGGLEIKVGGHTYTNSSKIEAKDGSLRAIRFTCTEMHYDPMSRTELLASISQLQPFSANSNYNTFKISDLYIPINNMDDEQFRGYIQTNKSKYRAGVKSGYEAVVRASSPITTDVKVITQGEDSFQAGKVKIVCQYPIYAGEVGEVYNYYKLDLENIKQAISRANIQTIGQDTIEVYENAISRKTIALKINIPKEYYTDAYLTLYDLKFKAALGYINCHQKIGQLLYPSHLVDVLSHSLSDISTDLKEFGIIENNVTGTPKNLYTMWKDYESLPIKGIVGTLDMSAIAPQSTTTMYFSYNSTATFTGV